MKKSVLFLLTWIIFTVVIAQPGSQKKYIDSSNMDFTVRPGDDFYQYANGGWLKNNPIPASRSRWGSFLVLSEQSSQALKQLLEDASNNPGKSRLTQMVGDFYASAMDSSIIESLGYTPIKKDLDRIAAITSINEVINEMATLRTKGIASPLFIFNIGLDARKTTQYIAYLGQGGISLTDRDYYLKNDPRSIVIRNEYKSYVTDLFKLTGVHDSIAVQNAADILELETKIANAQLSKVELRDPLKLYNKFQLDDFSKTTPHFNWRSLMEKMLVTGQDSLIVATPHFLRFIDSLLPSTPVATWKTYLQWNIIKNATGYLSNAFVQRNFHFIKVLSGQKEITPRWQRMAALIDGALGDLSGQLYVEKYFKPEAKRRMLALVNNLQKTFEDRIKQLDWMSNETKLKAIKKLYAIDKKIGYPDKWKTYDGVIITRNNFIENIRNCAQWNYRDRVSRLGKPADKSEWSYTPPTINASYSPTRNDITFPAAILQFPFFDFGADDAINYGGIGTVIGHEMTHGFDDQGRQYDADGNLTDWWTEEDAVKFKAKTEKMVELFNRFTVLDTIHVNGKLTSGENIADLGGLNIAYEAFKKTEQGKSNEKIDGLTPDQRFFLSFAQIWRGKILPETAAQFILIDPHSPNEYRINGIVKNVDAFYKAFNIKPGDKMYKPENERIRIW